ncbi:hypothetical protein ANCDUO_00385 [Ancylostoma duodenale]|uniref:Uncharacterized protein n=1 Tax=Ancylostoma duodenale TaxID=51022 RepID=A0A0C2H5Y1_9BILA|nr:hypothetical protein ANCDUO_00385 [Ancylostoma duodenale]
MQWYLIIPAIFVVQRLATSWEKTFFAGIAGCSITFYFGADNTTTFYSTFARLWQFLCGVAAFLEQDKTVGAFTETSPPILRQYRKNLQHGLEQQSLLVPSQNEIDEKVLFFGVLASGTLAIATHHGLESRYSKWSPPAISLLVALLLVSSSALSYRLHNQDDLVGEFGPGPVNYTSINVNDAAWNMTLMQYINTKEGNQTLNMETPYCERSKRFDEKDVPPGAFCETQATVTAPMRVHLPPIYTKTSAVMAAMNDINTSCPPAQFKVFDYNAAPMATGLLTCLHDMLSCDDHPRC